MSKVKTKIPSGSLTLLTKPNAAGECAVYLRYYLGSYIKKSTDIWVNQKDWDSKRQCVKSSAKNAARINARLYDIKGEIDKALLDYDGPITIDVIRSIMCGDDNSEVQLHSIKTCFIEYARYVNDMKYTKKAYGYSSWYNKVKYIDGGTFIDQTKNILISFLAAKSVISGDMALGMMMSLQYIMGQLNAP